MTETTEIAKVPTKENAMQVFTAPNGLDPFLAHIRAQIDGFTPDVSTRKGRDAIASIAHSVARSKTALDNVGKELVAELKDVPKKVDAERKRMRDLLDSWKEEVRRPLDEWEAAEAARVQRLQNGIEWFNLRANENADLDSAELKACIKEVESKVIGEKWEEFEAEAHRAKAAALESLTAQLAKREKYEADQAELERLRKEADARAEQDRIRAAQEAAVEAERQRAAKEQQEEREAAARREQELIDQAAKQEQEAENQRLQLKLQAEQAEREKLEATQRAEQAERDAKAKAEAAAQAERQRQADEQAEIQRQAAARQADTEHRTKILKQAKEAFMKMNITEELAKAIVLKIARGEVPNVTIKF